MLQLKKPGSSFKEKPQNKKHSDNVLSPTKTAEQLKPAVESESDVESPDEMEYKNKYQLIYPSERNTETEYNKYMAYAQQLFEKFTGSYSKKKEETPVVQKPPQL